MNYSYHWRWSSAFKRVPLGTKPLDIQVPFLFIFGGNKVGNFHSSVWQNKVAAKTGNQVVELPTHHWVMIERPNEFNQALLNWLSDN
jgi:pimeloyl-ACP methyl ester carboxylesterase